MNPAWSVLLLTTLIGAGQGLYLTLYAIEAAATMGAFALPAKAYFAAGSLLAVVLMGAGLVASFFHLGRPERAWRSAAMWRTSWLSREVIVLPALMGCVFLYGLGHWLGWRAQPIALGVDATLAIGAVGTLLCMLLF